MIPLRRIVEYTMLQGQGYDLGRDFTNFQRAVDTNTEQVKQRFESSINSKLAGKRVRARAAKGYKQFEKDYEFDISRVTIDDYYDNFVVVAHDESGKKPKEYFLSPGFKIQIIGLASGVQSPKISPNETQPRPPKVVASPEESRPVDKPIAGPMKETTSTYDAYSIDAIIDDIKPWASKLMKDSRLDVRKFVKSLGWMKTLPDGRTVAVYDLEFPIEDLKIRLSDKAIAGVLKTMSKPVGNVNVTYELSKFEPSRQSYKVRVKKTMRTNPNNQRVSSATYSVEEPKGV